jgi:CTP:molybdopterin cytidylyltransferase MocA
VIAAVVLAAGEGRRYGGLKQLHPVDGRPMLEQVLRTLARTGPEHRVVVLGAQPVVCDRWDAGQAASLHTGLAALPDDTDWALVVLGDGPHLDPLAVDRMAAAAESAGQTILAAEYGGGRSHPVLIPRARWSDIPDRGERPVRGLPADPVDCRDLTPPGDVDYA